MMKIPYVNLALQHKKIKNELLEAIESVLDTAHFVHSEEIERFEARIAEYCHAEYALGVNSGTDALYLSYRALGIGVGDEVLLPPNTFLATASSIIQVGATPVFVDVLEDYMIDPGKLASKLTSRTKAIVVVHLTGKPVDMDPVLQFAKKHNLFVIEDAAQAIGAEYKGRRVGGIGDIGCFSLHPVKTLNACGDGGAIVTNREDLYLKIKQLRNIGLKNRDEFDVWGVNSRLDTMQAAILNVKFAYLDSWNARRKEIAKRYIEELSQFVWVPNEQENERQVYHTFMIQTRQRDQLIEHLTTSGVETRIHYPIPIHLQNGAKDLGYKLGDFPVCEQVVKRMLSLPIHQDLTDDEVGYIIEQVKTFFSIYPEAVFREQQHVLHV